MTIKSKADLLTDFATTGNREISAARLRDLVDSIQSSFAGMYISTPAATTGMPLSTPVKALGETSQTSAVNFTHTDNRLTYTGTPDVHCHIALSCSFTSNKDNAVVGVYLAKNGITLPAPGLRTIANGADIGSTAVHGDVMLSTGDYIECWVSINQISSPSVTLDQMYIFVQGMLV